MSWPRVALRTMPYPDITLVGYCSRRPRPSFIWGRHFVGARAVGPWVGEQKPLGKSPLRGNPSPESTYLPTYLHKPQKCVPPGASKS